MYAQDVTSPLVGVPLTSAAPMSNASLVSAYHRESAMDGWCVRDCNCLTTTTVM